MIQSQGCDISLVVGNDIFLDQISDLVGKMVVGRFIGHQVNMAHLTIWVQENWVSVFGYGPIGHGISWG